VEDKEEKEAAQLIVPAIDWRYWKLPPFLKVSGQVQSSLGWKG
jgi:hypothetical protein